MAQHQPQKIAHELTIIFTLLLLLPSSSVACYKSIISFGDSLADTGNLIRLKPLNELPSCGKPPYGETFFHRPTGRSCDGRLVIDFIAESLELPYVKPYVGGDRENFSTGVNFAVGGATALGYSFFEKKGIINSMTNVSLGTQLEWFKRFFATLSDGKEFIGRSLVLMGEIGGNDYNNPISEGRSLKEIKSFVPDVVNYIASTIEELIEYGAKTILVPGDIPLGCLPVYLKKFNTSDEKCYDPETGCLIWLNEFAKYHNKHLIKKLKHVRNLHRDINIIYADYYNAALRLYLFPHKFGFSKGNILKACCGAGGLYNSDISCGDSLAKSCDDPSTFASWDGLHFTEAAYKWIARGLFEGPYTKPKFKMNCSSISKDGSGRVYEF